MANSSSTHSDIILIIEELFPRSLAQSLASLVGEEVEVKPASSEPGAERQLWFRSQLQPASCGVLEFGGSEDLLKQISRRILVAAEEAEPDAEIVESTLKEIAAQVFGAITSLINHEYQREVHGKEVQITGKPAMRTSAVHTSSYQLLMTDLPSVHLTLRVDERLYEHLATSNEIRIPVQPVTVDTKKLDLLLDVEMPVSVSIGRTQMPLKDVVKLTTGSIVELGRNVSEPVEVVVNNCVVARGDVVVVEGNFGVRICEVLSKEDRIRHLGPK